MDPKTDTPTTSPGTAPAPAPRAPWHQNELVRWGVGIALGFLLSWLSSRGITPTPVPVPPQSPSVLVLNVGQPVAPAAPVAVSKP